MLPFLLTAWAMLPRYNLSRAICVVFFYVTLLASAGWANQLNNASEADTLSNLKTDQKAVVTADKVISTMRQALEQLERENESLKKTSADPIAAWSDYYYRSYLPQRASSQIEASHKHQFMTMLLAWMVIIITLSGISFSGYQLWYANRVRKQTNMSSSEQDLRSDVKIDLRGVQASSNVVGIIVLVVSLAFFYLFMKEAYNIKIIDPDLKAAPPVP